MENREERLTVLKDYMTLSDMKNYFQFKDNKTFSECLEGKRDLFK